MCLGVPGQVLDVAGDDPLDRHGRVRFGEIVREVSLVYVPDVRPGEYVIVHVGFAIGRIDAAEAGRVFEYLKSVEDEGVPEAGDPET